jgi:hypothetical protein
MNRRQLRCAGNRAPAIGMQGQPRRSFACRRLSWGLWYGLICFLLPWRDATAETFWALEVDRLASYANATKQRELLAAVEALADRNERPLYILRAPRNATDLGAVGSGGPNANQKPRSWMAASLIYEKESTSSAVPGGRAIHIRDITHEDVVLDGLDQIERDRPREFATRDVIVLTPDDRDDLRKIVDMNSGGRLETDIPQFRAVANFVETPWDQKRFILTTLYPDQLTLVAGIHQDGQRMTVIHCFLSPLGSLPAIDVAPERQNVVRDLIGLLRDYMPIRVDVAMEGSPVGLTHSQLQEISERLGVMLSGSQGSEEPFHRIPRPDGSGRVVLLLLVPRSHLRGGTLVISLRSDRFRFLEPRSRRRVSEVRIDGKSWLGTSSTDTVELGLTVVEAFGGRGSLQELRSYSVPLEVGIRLARSDCRDRLNEGLKVSDGGSGRSEDSVPNTAGRVICDEVVKYLEAIATEMRIAKSLVGEGAKIQVILHERKSRWPSHIQKASTRAIEAISEYLKKYLPLDEDGVQELIGMRGAVSPQPSIEIRLVE